VANRNDLPDSAPEGPSQAADDEQPDNRGPTVPSGAVRKNDDVLNLVLAILGIAIAAITFFVKSPSSALGRLAFFSVIALAMLAVIFRGGDRRRVAISAIVLALTAGGAGVAAGEKFTSVPSPTPQIVIQNPIGGAWITGHPLISGVITPPLVPGQEIFSFNEPFTTIGLSRPMGQAFPDAGPCHSSDDSFTCSDDFPGGTASDPCRRFNLWVAVVTVKDGNEDNNIKDGLGPIYGQRYIKISEINGPPHIGSAVYHVTVQRYPVFDKSSC
jgi:hypothetical protein